MSWRSRNKAESLRDTSGRITFTWHQHPAKILGVERRGLYQRQERHLNRTKLPGSEAELHRGKFLGEGVLRFYGRSRRGCGP